MYMNILCRKFSKNPTKLFSPHIVTGSNIKKIIRRKTAATAGSETESPTFATSRDRVGISLQYGRDNSDFFCMFAAHKNSQRC